MEIIMIILLLLTAVAIMAVSFIKKDEHPEVDRKIENFSISLMKEIYQLTKKVDSLENEVFQNEEEKSFSEAFSEKDSQSNQIMKMNQDGFSTEEIAKVLAMAVEDVEAHLTDFREKSEVVSG
ncbi:hypothetical protein ACM26V_14195 [Salipaludibacillus sp. HK11]|uniref:hypothetical protein n=1 Tax=Salipaludibacillus sp. HK11 TaxID=3394320 RepID=UPI0039FD694A